MRSLSLVIYLGRFLLIIQIVYLTCDRFTMLFACGMGVGIYYWGVSEPMNYYRAGYQNRLFKLAFDNDDQRAQQAMFITLFHWGIHAWVVYIIMAILLGFVLSFSH